MVEALYIVMAVASYPLIVGMTFASLEHSFNDRGCVEVNKIKARQHLGFALTWGVLATAIWPASLPGVYLITGFAPYGIWTRYSIARCWQEKSQLLTNDSNGQF